MDALNLPSLSVLSVSTDGEDYLITAEAKTLEACPHDGGVLVGFGRRPQTYADLPMHGKRVTIKIDRRRWRCKSCGKVSLDPLPDMDDKRGATTRMVEYVRRESLKRTFVSLANEIGVHEKTIRNIFTDYAAYMDASTTFITPEVLGIDEIHMIGQARCVLTNVSERSLFDILPTRTKDVVYRRLVEMPDRKRVQIITIDMTRAYKDAAEAAFPNAVVVVDKWHVLRMANQCLEAVRKSVREGLSASQRRTLMHDRFILLKRPKSLTAQESIVLDLWTNAFPLLRQAYDLKEAFYRIYDMWDGIAAKNALVKWIESVPPGLTAHFAPLVTAVGNWLPEISAYFQGRQTNAYTEALNGLIRVANRMGRGYSFEVIRAKMLYSKGLHHHPKSIVARYEHTGPSEVRESFPWLIPEPDGSYGADISTLTELLEAEEKSAERTPKSE